MKTGRRQSLAQCGTAVIHADGSGLRYFDFQGADHPRWLPTVDDA